MADLPTAAEAFGAPPRLPSAEDAFGPAPVNKTETALGGADMDEYFSSGSPGYILDKFGQGAKDQWGTQPLGLTPEADAWLKKHAPDYGILGRAFHDEIVRPAAAALDFVFNRGPSALMGGVSNLAVGEPSALGSVLPGVIGVEFGVHAPPLDRAADLKVIGKGGERAYQGLPTAEELAAQREAIARLNPQNAPTVARQVSGEQFGPEIPSPPAEQYGPPAEAAVDLHAMARGIAPQVFEEYDALAAHRDTLRTWIAELGEMRDRGTSPQLETLDREIDDLRGRRLEEPAAAARGRMANAITALEEKRQGVVDALAAEGDTADMARLRKEMLESDYRMRDLAPDVSAAYRQAAEGITPAETPPEAPGTPEAPEATPVAAEPEPAAPAPAPAAAEAPKPTAEPIEGGIAGDVAKQLVAAGRPAEEADAAGALVEAHYEARAANLNVAPEDLYREEAPTVRAGRGARQAGNADLVAAQGRRGKITLATDQAKATITLFKNADASTFIHETGHQWLEELVKDAADERATDQVKTDAATVRDWLGVGEEEEIPTKAHEKFARGFERYMMEGHAPSSALAQVFAKFRDWLTRIYETVSRLRSPINDDIRQVFDRMLTTGKEEPVIAPEREPTGSFADIHEADAEHTAAERAIDAWGDVRDERDMIGEAAAPEIEDERLAGRSGAEGTAGTAEAPAGGPMGGAVPGEQGAGTGSAGGSAPSVPQPGAERAGGGEATPEGNRLAVATGDATLPIEPAAERLIDKAGNIRLDNLAQPEDVDEVIRLTAERNNDFLQNRRGAISDGQLLDLADALGMDPAFLDGKKIGQAFNAEEVLAARRLLVQSAAHVRDLMAKAAEGNEADLARLAQAIVRHEMIQGKVAQATAEWGRAGRAFRNLEGWEQARDLNQFLKENAGRDLNQLKLMARLGKTLETAQQLSKFIADTHGGVRKAITYYWVNTLISGPITHLTYSAGNAINALWRPLVETPLAATSGAVREALGIPAADRVYFGEVSAELYGLGRGFREGLRAATLAWETGVSPILPGERVPSRMIDASLTNPLRELGVPRPIAEAVGVPGRAVSAIHSFFKAIRYEQNIQALALRDALSRGLEGDARDLEVARLSISPTEGMMDRASADALKELYMRRQPYDSPGAYLTRATNSWLPAKIVAPFVKIGSEIVRNAFVERTPLGIGSPEVRGNLLGREGGAAFDMQLGKIMAGTGLMAATAIGVLEGNITGDGPSDPNERRVWLMSHKPTHVAIGPLSFNYARLGHLSMLMRFAANMTETADRWSDEDGAKLAKGFFDGIARSVLDETWMRGVKDVFDAIYHPEEYFDRWLPRFVAQWTPYSIGLGQIARKVDPYQRETRDLSMWNETLNEFRSHTPWMSQSLPLRRDLFGEPIPSDYSGPDRYQNDRVMQTMDALHIGLAAPQRKIRGVQLTPQQYDDYQRIGGRLAKVQLDAIVGPAFRLLPMATQIKMIHDTVSHARESAAAQLMMQSVGAPNDIIAKSSAAKAVAAQGATPLAVKERLKALH